MGSIIKLRMLIRQGKIVLVFFLQFCGESEVVFLCVVKNFAGGNNIAGIIINV